MVQTGAGQEPGDPRRAVAAERPVPPAEAAYGGAAAKQSRHRVRRVAVLFAVAVVVFALDVVSKVIVVATLPHHPPVRLPGGLLTLRLIRNPGAAFSIGTSMTIVFTLIAVGVIVYILRAARRLHSLPWAVALGLLLGGAAGNLTDRLFRAPGPLQGYVVDWIELPHWPVFNLADAAICCSGALIVLLAARGIRLDGTRERRDGEGPPSAGENGAGENGEGGSRPALRAGTRGPRGRAARCCARADVRPVQDGRRRPDQRGQGTDRRAAGGEVRPGGGR